MDAVSTLKPETLQSEFKFVRVSQSCFIAWCRCDPEGLQNLVAERGGKLYVRVPVPRQRWPNRTMAD